MDTSGKRSEPPAIRLLRDEILKHVACMLDVACEALWGAA